MLYCINLLQIGMQIINIKICKDKMAEENNIDEHIQTQVSGSDIVNKQNGVPLMIFQKRSI